MWKLVIVSAIGAIATVATTLSSAPPAGAGNPVRSAIEKFRPGRPKPMPLPLAGTGLPVLLAGAGYLLWRRRR